jgi:hypothetical protein
MRRIKVNDIYGNYYYQQIKTHVFEKFIQKYNPPSGSESQRQQSNHQPHA